MQGIVFRWPVRSSYGLFYSAYEAASAQCLNSKRSKASTLEETTICNKTLTQLRQCTNDITCETTNTQPTCLISFKPGESKVEPTAPEKAVAIVFLVGASKCQSVGSFQYLWITMSNMSFYFFSKEYISIYAMRACILYQSETGYKYSKQISNIYISLYLSIYLSVCLSIYLPTYLSIYLPTSLSLSPQTLVKGYSTIVGPHRG